MTQNETKELIQQYYDAFNQQDMERFFSLLDQDIIHDINHGHQEIGKEAFIKFMHSMNHSYKEIIKSPLIMTNEDGSRAAAEFTVEGEYLATAQGLPEARKQKYELLCGAFFSIKAGKITRVTTYYNLHDWLTQIKG